MPSREDFKRFCRFAITCKATNNSELSQWMLPPTGTMAAAMIAQAATLLTAPKYQTLVKETNQ